MNTFVMSGFAIAIAGLGCTLFVHITALSGLTSFYSKWSNFLFAGILFSFTASVLVTNRRTKGVLKKDIWNAALRGCPNWMRQALWVIVTYSMIGYFFLPIVLDNHGNATLSDAQSMSAMLLSFFAVPVALMFSAMNPGDS